MNLSNRQVILTRYPFRIMSIYPFSNICQRCKFHIEIELVDFCILNRTCTLNSMFIFKRYVKQIYKKIK